MMVESLDWGVTCDVLERYDIERAGYCSDSVGHTMLALESA